MAATQCILDVVKATCWSSKRASKWAIKGMEVTLNAVPEPDGLPIWKLLLIYWGFRTQPSLGFSENDPKSSKQQLRGGKYLVGVREGGKWADRKRKATGNQINTEVCRVARLNASNLETWANVYALTGHSIRHEQGVPNYKVVYECIQMSRWDICFEDQMHVKTNYGWTAFRQSNVNKLSALLCFIYT